MALALGAASLIDTAMPAAVDSGLVLSRSLADGVTQEETIALAGTLIGEENSRLEQQYGGIVTFTYRDFARDRQGSGGRSMTPRSSEFASPDPVRSTKTGHMFPEYYYRDANAWSEEYWDYAIREDVRDTIIEVRDRWRNRVENDLWRRALMSTDDPIGSGYSPGWAIGTGSQVNYVPPQHGNYEHTSAHKHYKRINGAVSSANALLALDDAAKELAHHGHIGDKVAFVSDADVAHYIGITDARWANFIPAEFIVVGQGSTSEAFIRRALQGVPGQTIGYFASAWGVVEVRSHDRIPTGYLFMTKSYGNNSPDNGIAVRLNSNRGFGMMVKAVPARDDVTRIEELRYVANHGVGVNDRLNGIAYQMKTGSATYENPSDFED